jgi:hypothetical protein
VLRRRRSRNLPGHESPGVLWKLEKARIPPCQVEVNTFKTLDLPVFLLSAVVTIASPAQISLPRAVSTAGSSVFVLTRDSSFGLRHVTQATFSKDS